jgi:hypothetical protein
MNGPNATPVDFAETPSMLMEQYAFLPSVLKRVGRHYSYISEEYNAAWKEGKNETVKQPSEILSDDAIEQLRVNKNAYSAWDAINQVFLGTYDMRINALPPSELDSTALFNQVHSSAPHLCLIAALTRHSRCERTLPSWKAPRRLAKVGRRFIVSHNSGGVSETKQGRHRERSRKPSINFPMFKTYAYLLYFTFRCG